MATNSRTSRRSKQKKQKKSIWKRLLKYTSLFILLACIIGGGFFIYFIVTAPDLDPDKLDVPYAAQLYDQDGNQFADMGEENRVKVNYDDLPEELIDAVVATEDSRFYKHKGIDLRRIGGAIKANIQRGFGAEGASTITQQVVEQMFLTPDKSIKRKVQEQWLALKLERQYSKEEIMEMYLNKNFYGGNAYGVGKAAEVYFDKEDLSELTLLENAILAGLPQRPTAYNPFKNPDLTAERVDTVLTLMVRHGYISEEEAGEARQSEIESVLTDKEPSGNKYDAFVDKVLDELDEKLTDVDVYSAGLKVHTTLDTKAQDRVELLLSDAEDNPIAYPDDDLKAGMAVLDTQSGAIQAIGGGRNRENKGYNYAYNDKGRQPGSVFKPIAAYGPAIENEEWSTYHQINDDKPYEKGGSNPIRNWDRQYHGWLSIRQALAQSYNVPAAKTFEETGSDNVKEFANGLGIEFADETLDARDAIGGSSTNTTPLELAGAYAAFGNEGIYTEPYAVTEVEFSDGSTVDLTPESEAAMSDYTAYMITDILKDVVKSGTGTNANIPSLDMAGKTGTTNLADSWFSGYTTDYTISIWTGYDDQDTVMPDDQVPHRLFTNTMEYLSEDTDTEDFTKPDSVVEVDVQKGSNPPSLASENAPSDSIVTELFVKGTEPDKVSEEYEELDAVSDLKAEYKEDDNEIDISWDYDDDADVSFEVSYQTDDGDMKELTTTEDKDTSLSSVEEGKKYTIQVIAVSNESDTKSDAATTTVDLSAEEDDDNNDDNNDNNNDDEDMDLGNLQAQYNNGGIDISWDYSGPDASFELDINGQTQSVDSTSEHFDGAEPGETYNITVTPVAGDQRGDSEETSITIPNDEDNNNDNSSEEEQNENENNNEENENEEDNNSENNVAAKIINFINFF